MLGSFRFHGYSSRQDLLCWAYLFLVLETAGLKKVIHKEAIYCLNLRIAGVSEGGIDLLSVMGIHSLYLHYVHIDEKN